MEIRFVDAADVDSVAGMEVLPSLDSVLQALDALYHQPDADGKHKASLWLTDLQSSVCFILHLPNALSEFAIKGANRRRRKVGNGEDLSPPQPSIRRLA